MSNVSRAGNPKIDPLVKKIMALKGRAKDVQDAKLAPTSTTQSVASEIQKLLQDHMGDPPELAELRTQIQSTLNSPSNVQNQEEAIKTLLDEALSTPTREAGASRVSKIPVRIQEQLKALHEAGLEGAAGQGKKQPEETITQLLVTVNNDFSNEGLSDRDRALLLLLAAVLIAATLGGGVAAATIFSILTAPIAGIRIDTPPSVA